MNGMAESVGGRARARRLGWPTALGAGATALLVAVPGLGALGPPPAGAVPITPQAVTLYVDATNGTTTTCAGSGTAACPTLQDALDVAFAQDTADDVTIDVAGGFYFGSYTIGTWPAGTSLTIAGAGATNTYLEAAAPTALTIAGGTVTVSGATIESIETAVLVEDGTVTLSGDEIDDGSGVVIDAGTLDATGDTFSFDRGGAVSSPDAGTALTLTNDTFIEDSPALTENADTVQLQDDTVFSGSHGAIDASGGTVTLADSIVDTNQSPACQGPVVDGGYNVESDTSCAAGPTDLVTTNPGFSSYGTNGSSGPFTLALSATGPAVDEVPASACTLSTDERGDPRPGIVVQSSCDPGAYEYQYTPGTLTQLAPTGAQFEAGVTHSYQLALASNPPVPPTFTTTQSAPPVTVSSSGLVVVPAAAMPGTYDVAGTVGDTFGDTGMWSFTVTITPSAEPCGAGGTYSQTATTATCAYSDPGTESAFMVPAGVTSVDATAVGAPGGNGTTDDSNDPGGTGGEGAVVVNPALPVDPGSTLYVDVGSPGDDSTGGTPGGGNTITSVFGNGAGGGGGYSALSTAELQPNPTVSLTGGAGTDPRLLVAGGGGGGGIGTENFSGTPGGSAGDPQVTGAGSGGSPGGTGGVGGPAGTGCSAGAPGQGGNWSTNSISGGGGGGWFGGGAGCNAPDAGGAGSSYTGVEVRGAPAATVTTANTSQAPEVVITWSDIAPTITSAASTTFATGQAGSFTVTATGYPVPALKETGALPAGVTFTDNHNGTATLAGTPPLSATGSYPVTITATNGFGSPAVQHLTIDVKYATVVTVLPIEVPAQIGQQEIVLVTVSADGGGTVSLQSSFDGGPPVPVAGCQNLPATADAAVCRFTPATPPGPGTDTLTATYSGDTAFAPAQGSATLPVVAPTTLTISTSPTPAKGSPLTVTATVTPTPDAGTVTVTAHNPNGTLVTLPAACSGAALTAGTATCTFTPTQTGLYSLTTAYSGDALYLPTATTTLVSVTTPRP